MAIVNIFDKNNLKSFLLNNKDKDTLEELHNDILRHIVIDYHININNKIRETHMIEYYKQLAFAKGVM